MKKIIIVIDSIQELIKYKRYSIGEIESKCGVSPGYFSRIRGNEKCVGFDTIYKLSKAIDVSLDELAEFIFDEEVKEDD